MTSTSPRNLASQVPPSILLNAQDDTPHPPTVHPGNPRWSRKRARPQANGCYLYLFIHKYEPRLKIGVSQAPLNRLQMLDEALDVDMARSIVVRLDSPKRAKEVEGLLHKALSAYRISPDARSRHDGDTEWFALGALPLATQLLLDTPSSHQSTGFLLEQLIDHAVDTDLIPQPGQPIFGEEGVKRQFLLHNLKVIQSVSQTLMRVGQDLDVQVSERTPKRKQQAVLVIKGFKSYGTHLHASKAQKSGPRTTWNKGSQDQIFERYQLRMQVLDLDRYELKSRQPLHGAHQWLATPSLIRSISYGAGKEVNGIHAGLDDLVLRMASPHELAALEGGEQLISSLDVLMAQLDLAILMGHRSQMRGQALGHALQQRPTRSRRAPAAH